jgi:NADPH:quinone reductase-like Zn-dependent oxidoreductase
MHVFQASTVSTRDCIIRADDDTNTSFTPFVPGFQVVGQVCALGPEVNPFQIRVGDRVAALLPRGGGNAKYISTHSSLAIILPESVNHDDIICLVSNYMIAYQCLKLAKKDGAPLTNANVLITRASGPVGQALIELALQEGANVYSTAHKMHEEHLTKLGTKWFSVKPEKWLPVLEGKMDVVIDTMTIDGYESSYRALTDNGILICNVSDPSKLQRFSKSNDNPGLSIWWSTLKAKLFWSRAIFYELEESYQTNPRLFAQELNYLACKLQRGEIRPKVAGRVTLNQVPKAQQLIEKGLPSKFYPYQEGSSAQCTHPNLMLFTQMVQWYAYHGRDWTPIKR